MFFIDLINISTKNDNIYVVLSSRISTVRFEKETNDMFRCFCHGSKVGRPRGKRGEGYE